MLKVPIVVLGYNDRILDDADLSSRFLQLETQSDSVNTVGAVLASDAFADAPQRIVSSSDSEIFESTSICLTSLA